MRSLLVGALSLVALGGCGGDSTGTSSSGAPIGSEGGSCYPNGTCDAGLSCFSDLCVNASGSDGGPAGAGGSATGGAGAGGANPSGGAAVGGAGAGGIPVGGAGAGGTATSSCGDGLVSPPESCDDGNRVDRDACPDGSLGTCQAAICGDGILRLGVEQCDDGGTAPGDGCDASCNIEGITCGNDTVEAGETCDSASLTSSDQLPGDCSSVCRTNCQCPACGDGVTDFPRGEECDDGNTSAGDGCDAGCHIERPATCGDGDLDVAAGEECDDDGTAAGDGCSASCQFEPVGATCGDSTQDTGEKCDPPNGTPAVGNGNGCNQTCNLNGVVTTLNSNIDAEAMTSDQQYLWLGACPGGCGALQRIDIDACISGGSCAPTTVAGGSCPTGGPVDGNGTSAELTCIGTITTDGSKVWFGNSHTIRSFDITTGDVTTLAGRANSCAAVDGIASDGYFHDVRGMTYWNGFVYLLDGCEQTLRRFDPVTGGVVTIAGTRHADPSVTQQAPYTCPGSGFTCQSGTPTSGQGLGADFGSPRYMTADNGGNLYITDTNGQAVWRYNTVTGWAQILISGSSGGLGNAYGEGPVSSTTLGRPRGVVSDGTSLYFNEQNYATLRQLQLSTLTTSTFVGTEGCRAINNQAPRDGTGADSTQTYAEPQFVTSDTHPDPCIAGIPSGTPIFGTLMGAITYHFPTRSIYLLDGGNRLRRVE